MPKLIDPKNRNTKKIVMDYSTTKDDEAWVEVYTDYTGGEVLQLQSLSKIDPSTKQINISESSLGALIVAVQSWNYEDSAGSTAKINKESFKLLPAPDFIQLVNSVVDLIGKTKDSITKSDDDRKKKT